MTPSEVVDRLLEEAPAAMAQVFDRGSRCMVASILGQAVLAHYDIEADLWPCELLAQRTTGHVTVELSAAAESNRNRWGGHMTLVSGAALLDLDLGQLERRWRLPVPPAGLFEYGPPPWRYLVGEVKLEYRAHPAPESWRRGDMSEGRIRAFLRPLVGYVIRKIREERPRGRPRVGLSYTTLAVEAAARIGRPVP